MPYKNRKKEYEKRRKDRVLEKLAAFEEFEATVAPKLREMLINGATAEEVIDQTAALAAARIATIAMTEVDSAKALAAAKDIIDRSKGKAVERKQLEHKFDRLDEDALDALVISKLKEAAIAETALLTEATDDTEDSGDGDS